MSNVSPRQARARSEMANAVTSGSSEKLDCEPQSSRKARFEALKRCFETPIKSKEERPSHGPVKRQRLFQTTKTAHPQVTILLDPPEDPMAQPVIVTEQDHHAKAMTMVSQYSEVPCLL